jgi:MinD-like ATPase involved in chromosome partitioning or flagellar assembly/DNA-binding NarL/FixJ family response regulator
VTELEASDERRPLWFVVLDEDRPERERIERLFLGDGDLRLAGGAAHVEDAVRLVRENGADVVLVDHGLAQRPGLEAAGALAQRLPAVRVYLATPHPSRELWDEARRRGIRGLVRKPYDPETLARTVREDLQAEAWVARDLGPAEQKPAPTPEGAVGGSAPETLAVFSFKGGVGKSLVSVSLALQAASATSRRRRSCVLVDAEDGVGSTAALLGVAPTPSVLDWGEYRGERQVDPAIAMRMLAETRTGLHCLFAPSEADRGPDAALLDTVLGTLSRMFALVVVDCAAQPTEAVLRVLQLATGAVLVVEPALDCLERVHAGTLALERAGIALSKFRVLVNRNRPGAGDFSAAEVREALGLPVLGTLPFDPAAKRAANQHRPLAREAPHGPFMTALRRAMEAELPGIAEARGVRRPRLRTR